MQGIRLDLHGQVGPWHGGIGKPLGQNHRAFEADADFTERQSIGPGLDTDIRAVQIKVAVVGVIGYVGLEEQLGVIHRITRPAAIGGQFQLTDTQNFRLWIVQKPVFGVQFTFRAGIFPAPTARDRDIAYLAGFERGGGDGKIRNLVGGAACHIGIVDNGVRNLYAAQGDTGQKR